VQFLIVFQQYFLARHNELIAREVGAMSSGCHAHIAPYLLPALGFSPRASR